MPPLVGIVLARLVWGVVSLLAVSVIIFSAVEMLPGDFASAILGQSATPEALANLRHELGLDLPAGERFVRWLGGVIQGDFGISLSGRPVAEVVLPRMGHTLLLAGLAAGLALPVAFALGVMAAARRGGWLDRVVNSSALALAAMPEFLTGYLLIYWLAVRAGWLPPVAAIHDGMGAMEQARRLVLPVITLSLVVMAHVLRMTRAALGELMERPWMEMAGLKGLPRGYRVWRHALPNAWGPIANIFAFNIAWLISGVVVTEAVFVYPGAGQLMVDAVASRDIPVVQACALIFAAVYIGLNLLADLVALLTNPRLRYPR